MSSAVLVPPKTQHTIYTIQDTIYFDALGRVGATLDTTYNIQYTIHSDAIGRVGAT